MIKQNKEVIKIENILDILNQCDFLHLALCDENKPYIVPMNFGYENNNGKIFIYLHGAKAGKKSEMIDKNPNICFSAECSYKTVEAEKTCGWTAQYQSVIGEGIISKIENIADKTHALDTIMKHYKFPGKPEYHPKMIAATMVLKIEVSSISGKQHLK